MKLESSLQQRQELRLISYQSLEILQLPILELQTAVEQELLENPVLELKGEIEEPPAEAGSDEAALAMEPGTPPEEDKTASEDMTAMDNAGEEWKEYIYQQSSRRSFESDEDKKMEALQNTPARIQSLQDYLYYQLTLLSLGSEKKKEFASYIVYNTDENGYLRSPLADLRTSFNNEMLGKEHDPNAVPPERLISEEEAADCLRVIQSLDPAGVAAHDIKECLLLQLDETDANYELKKRLISEFMDDISHNRLPKVAKEFNMSVDDLKLFIHEISRLNPKPGAEFSSATIPYIIPDATIEKDEEGIYSVKLEKSFVPALRINNNYRTILRDKRTSKEVKDFIRQKMDSAKKLVAAIQQRENTIQRIIAEITTVQKDFLEKGHEYIKPLKMQEVADKIGVNVSTVSRTVSNKYIQTPQGLYSLRYFFSGGSLQVTENIQGQISRISIIEKIKQILQNENKDSPMSDADVVEGLKKDGISISRRTVTKYRKAANIFSSRSRKNF
ncbi:MAG: RNA polymerase factor sigma-54 [Planctomycetes bacterium]|nr:RNA polymerase factor sigma-54 [Planctomycetota bacterium]